MMYQRLVPAALILVLLAACGTAPVQGPSASRPVARSGSTPAPVPAPAGKRGGGYYLDDGPGDNTPADLDAIPDAVPRVEPIRAANTRPYEVMGQSFRPLDVHKPFTQSGIGSWYGRKFHGANTASGEPYDMYGMTAAHPTLPIPSYARVTNLENDRQVVVRVNDRGPFLHSRIIDLSYTAAYKLGYVNKGSARLRVDLITPEEIEGGRFQTAARPAPARAPEPVLARAVAPAVQPLPQPVPAPASARAPEPQLLPAAQRQRLEAPPVPTALPAVVAGNAATPADPADPVSTVLAGGAAADTAAEVAAQPGVFLQLGAFASSANAESFRDYVQTTLTWLDHGVRTQLVGDKFRLRVGPFRDVAEARSMALRIAEGIGTRPFVVQ